MHQDGTSHHSEFVTMNTWDLHPRAKHDGEGQLRLQSVATLVGNLDNYYPRRMHAATAVKDLLESAYSIERT